MKLLEVAFGLLVRALRFGSGGVSLDVVDGSGAGGVGGRVGCRGGELDQRRAGSCGWCICGLGL